jgi:hypothetical protein
MQRPDRFESSIVQRRGFSPAWDAVVYVCGLTGTITAAMHLLIDRGFVPRAPRIRQALGVPHDAKDGLFFELYDVAPLIDVSDRSVVQPLRHGC